MSNCVYTRDCQKISNCLPLMVTISNPFTLAKKEYEAIFDTGATNTVITQKIFDELLLPKIYCYELMRRQ